MRTSESGAAIVEFAVVLPLLLLILLGILDFGRAMNYFNDATQMANEGARWAAVNKDPGSGSLAQYVLDQADTSELKDNSTVCVTALTDPAQIGDPVQVTVEANFDFLPFLKLGTVKMTGSAVMRFEQTPDASIFGCASG